MRRFGFSTGALALGDFRRALDILYRQGLPCVELSALRENEVVPLLGYLDEIKTERFVHISFHAPSSYPQGSEDQLISLLTNRLPEAWGIVLHPDAAHELNAWKPLAGRLWIENMDKRKHTGRSVKELRGIFETLPDAGFCFDIGHARQFDPTMVEARKLLEAFGRRLRQVHLSEVNTSSRHDRLSLPTIWSFREVAHLIPEDVPIIIEAPVTEEEIAEEVTRAGEALPVAVPG